MPFFHKTHMFFKKFLVSFMAAWILVLSVAPFSIAAAATATPAPTGTWYNSSFQDWYSKVYDDSNQSEIFGERYTAAQVQWVVYGLLSFLVNQTSNQKLLSCLFKNSANLNACASLLTYSEKDLQELANRPKVKEPSLASLVFSKERSFSGINYVREKVDNFSLVPEAHAQTVGFGFNALKPVQAMWQTSRDLAFGLFVLAAIVFAFMIMFRVKISPQVVISVQTALPKLIGALILVTFSYAIAGFLVDLMYVVYGLVALLGKGFIPFGGAGVSPATVFEFMTAGRVGGAGAGIELGLMGLLFIYLVLLPISFVITLFLTIGVLGAAVIGLVGTILAPLFAGLGTIMALVAIVLVIILIIVIIWQLVKIIFGLLKAYTNIILLTIFAPVQIVAGVFIPSLGFGSWLRSYVTNLGIFVLTSVLIFFSFVFLEQGVALAWEGLGSNIGAGILSFIFGQSTIANLGGFFVNNSAWPPLLSSTASTGGGTGLLMLGVSFVLFTLIPKATEVLQGLMSGRPFAYGTAIGEAFGPVAPFAEYGKGAAMRAAIRKGVQMDNEGRLPSGGMWTYLKEGLRDAAEQQRMSTVRGRDTDNTSVRPPSERR